MSLPLLAGSCLLLVSVSSLGAMDVEFLDLRLGVGMLSNNFEGSSTTTVTDNSTHVSTTTDSSRGGRDADNHYRGQFQLVWGNLGPFGGLILGGGIAANHARFKNGPQEAEVTTPVVDVLIGYGYAVSKSWHFELTPFAGAGRAYYHVSDEGSSSTSNDTERYYEYGAKIGTYVTSESGMQIGIDIPYLVGRFNPKYDHSEADSSYSVTDSRRNEGFGLLVTIGQRF